jgi:hypothetical protein
VNRREFIASAGLAAGSLALPARVAAQVGPDLRTTAILDSARAEMNRSAAQLWRRDIVGVADFAAHSAYPRFHVANLESGTVRSFRVAHGAGSDPEHDGWLKWFSNVPGSNATSRGSYITWEWYAGKYGTSVRLGGLDPDNSNAFDRAIVMHSAEYATQAHLDHWGKLGRSNGCFAFSPDDFYEILAQLSGGRLIFADRLGFI